MIDHVRRRRATKRGGEFHITSSDSEVPAAAPGESAVDLEQLGAALEALADVNPGLAQLVDLHFFCGYSFSIPLSSIQMKEMRLQNRMGRSTAPWCNWQHA